MSGSSALLIEALVNEENTFSTNEDFGALLEESYQDTPSEGNVVQGVVVAIENDFVIMDVGVKSEGRIPLKEFSEAGKIPEIAVGDTFDIYVEKFEDRNGEAQLSRERAVRGCAPHRQHRPGPQPVADQGLRHSALRRSDAARRHVDSGRAAVPGCLLSVLAPGPNTSTKP